MTLQRVPHWTINHGFSTREGGFSEGCYAGLNLDDREDDPAVVTKNRAQLAAALSLSPEQFARLEQVHGTDVLTVSEAGYWVGDALVTNKAGVALVIGTADCLPILLHDPVAGVIGAAHAGWRGTVGHIAIKTLEAMTRLGASPKNTRAALGPAISAAQYEIGAEVAGQWADAGLGEWVKDGHADLAGANTTLLQQAGVQDVWQSPCCSTEPQFYSYRRDKGKTGRMWSVISL